jgi:hypothetical protein
MQRIARTWLLALATLAFAACASPVENSWTDPSVAGKPLELRKVAAIALLEEGALRRVAEDELVRAIQGGGSGVAAVAGYTVLRTEDLASADSVRAKLAAAGFDGAVVVRVVDSRERITSTPGVGVGWGRYGGWGGMYDTPTIRTDTIVRVQTNIYAVEGARLLWSGTTRTLNPRDVSELIDDVVRDVGKELRNQGLIATPAS